MLYATKYDAIHSSEKGKCSPHFTAEIIFADGETEIIADDVKGSALTLDLVKAYAASIDPLACIAIFGVRGDDRKPTDRERVLRRALNGGSLKLSLGQAVLKGTFVGYSAAR